MIPLLWAPGRGAMGLPQSPNTIHVVPDARSWSGGPAADPPGTTTSNGITRAALGEAQPADAPGQELYLQRVTIAPGAKLVEHFHQGTQVARVVSGVLTYDIASGSATVTHVDGKSETIAAPATIKLRPGESLVATP